MKVKVQKSTTHGIGVFATKDIKKGDVVEVCPMMLFPEKEKKILDEVTKKILFSNSRISFIIFKYFKNFKILSD